ncbi:MAG: hypothetical protein GXY85_05340 [Candidatus Brocadiaceae bacterium]|nr:hypothetical protein [Candidatus Brocadiaceae bacterium]
MDEGAEGIAQPGSDGPRRRRRARWLPAVLLGLVAVLRFGCTNHMIYHPTSEVYGTSWAAGPAFEEGAFGDSGGPTLSGWFVPAAGEPKELVTIPDGEHTDAFMRRDPRYRGRLLAFYSAALAGRAAPSAGER